MRFLFAILTAFLNHLFKYTNKLKVREQLWKLQAATCRALKIFEDDQGSGFLCSL